MSLQDFFHLLSGQWQLVRQADDGTSWTGKAQVEQLQEDKLLYEEAVESVKEGKTFSGFQRHILRWENDKILFFESARPSDTPFLTLSLGQDTFVGEGTCLRDQYNATYVVQDSDNWEANYTVKGPHKNYQLHTVYKRLF